MPVGSRCETLLVTGGAAPRAPERGDAKVEEDDDHDDGGHKGAVIGTMRPICPGAPSLRPKDDYRQQKKDSRYFEPQDPAYAPKGAQKSLHTLYNAAAGLHGGAAGGVGGNCSRAISRTRTGSGTGGRNSLRRARQLLSRDAPCNANADAECAADGLRFHTVYDGNSDPYFRGRGQLPIALFRHRKYGS